MPAANTVRRGKGSFRRVVLLKEGEVCSMEKHFVWGTVYRAVVGWLDYTAGLNPWRHIFAHVERIVEGAKKLYKGKGRCEKRQVENVLEFIREKGIATIRDERERPDGDPRQCFIIAHHDDVTVRQGNKCTFIGCGLPGEEGKPLPELNPVQVHNITFFRPPTLAEVEARRIEARRNIEAEKKADEE